MNDPIFKMTKEEIRHACMDLVGYPACETPLYPYHNLVGLIIAKLQEWGCDVKMFHGGQAHISFDNGSKAFRNTADCLQGSFLRTAIALGKWEAPKMKEEPKLAHFLVDDSRILSVSLGANSDISYYTEGRGFKRVRVTPWEEAK